MRYGASVSLAYLCRREGRDIPELEDPREAPRRPVHAEVQLRRSGELNFTVEVHDLSARGCRTEFVERPRIGEIVWVKFGGLSAVESTVRWVEGFHGGIEFNSPVNPAVLEMIIRDMR